MFTFWGDCMREDSHLFLAPCPPLYQWWWAAFCWWRGDGTAFHEQPGSKGRQRSHQGTFTWAKESYQMSCCILVSGSLVPLFGILQDWVIWQHIHHETIEMYQPSKILLYHLYCGWPHDITNGGGYKCNKAHFVFECIYMHTYMHMLTSYPGFRWTWIC